MYYPHYTQLLCSCQCVLRAPIGMSVVTPNPYTHVSVSLTQHTQDKCEVKRSFLTLVHTLAMRCWESWVLRSSYADARSYIRTHICSVDVRCILYVHAHTRYEVSLWMYDQRSTLNRAYRKRGDSRFSLAEFSGTYASVMGERTRNLFKNKIFHAHKHGDKYLERS